MGLSIHYSGSLKNPESLPELVNEVKDIVEVFGWEYHVFRDEFPGGVFLERDYTNKLYGIGFSMPGCETLFICFLSNGRMISPFNLEHLNDQHYIQEKKYLYTLSCKTQFAGIEKHKFLIHLFGHLSQKYFENFRMIDEGGYWESRDEEILRENFNRYERLVDTYSEAVDKTPQQPGESLENYLERLFRRINKERGDDKL
jgi:hypothetical protein